MNVALNIQSIIFSLLACLVLFLAFLVIIVVFCGILRIAIISVFELDVIKWWKSREKKVNSKKKKDNCDLPEETAKQMGYYKLNLERKDDENIQG